MRNKRVQSLPEERANSLSHGAGLLAAVLGAPLLIKHALTHGDAIYAAGAALFAATVIFLYGTSALYHGLPAGKGKRLMRILDHASIFLLIAGTYTPFTLGVLRGTWGWTLFGLIWTLAIIGIALKVLGRASNPLFSTGLYLLMGWLIVIAAKPLFASVPIEGLLWLLAGGLAYTAGVIFYATDSRLRYGHLVWHLFVLTGTACHYVAVFTYAV